MTSTAPSLAQSDDHDDDQLSDRERSNAQYLRLACLRLVVQCGQSIAAVQGSDDRTAHEIVKDATAFADFVLGAGTKLEEA